MIQEAVVQAFSNYPNQLGTDLEVRDTIPYSAFGQEVQAPRLRQLSLWLYPGTQRAAFQYEELIFNAFEIPVRTYHFGMVDNQGTILWMLDSANFYFSMDEMPYHPDNINIIARANIRMSLDEVRHCLADPEGKILVMEKEPVFTLGSLDNKRIAMFHYPLNTSTGQYRIAYHDLVLGKQWERYYYGPGTRLIAMHYEGRYLLVSIPDTLICLDHTGKEVWRKSLPGIEKSFIFTSTFRTFLVKNQNSTDYLVLGEEMKDTLGRYGAGSLSNQVIDYCGMAVAAGTDIYGLFPLVGRGRYRINIIDETQQLINKGIVDQPKAKNAYTFLIMEDKDNGLRVYYGRTLINEMEGWKDGTDRSDHKKSD
jgi:hypothetical protein